MLQNLAQELQQLQISQGDGTGQLVNQLQRLHLQDASQDASNELTEKIKSLYLFLLEKGQEDEVTQANTNGGATQLTSLDVILQLIGLVDQAFLPNPLKLDFSLREVDNQVELAGAFLDKQRRHKYLTWRLWDKDKPILLFLLGNPATINDYDSCTLLACKQIAQEKRCGAYVILNIFSYIKARREFFIPHLFSVLRKDPGALAAIEINHRIHELAIKTLRAGLVLVGWGDVFWPWWNYQTRRQYFQRYLRNYSSWDVQVRQVFNTSLMRAIGMVRSQRGQGREGGLQVQLLCLGKNKTGNPKHPRCFFKKSVPEFIYWSEQDLRQ